MIRGLSEKIRVERARLHLTQKELGKMVGVESSSISQYENDSATPSAEVLMKLGGVFGVSLSYLTGIDKQETMMIEGLNDEQITVVKSLVKDMRELNHYREMKDSAASERE